MPVAKTTIGIVSVTALDDDYLDFDLYVGVSPYFTKLGSYSYSESTFTPTGANGSASGPLTVIITGEDTSFGGFLEYDIQFDDGSEMELQLDWYVESERRYVDNQGNCFRDPELTLLNNSSVVEESISVVEGISDPASYETTVEDEISFEEDISDDISETVVEEALSIEEGVSDDSSGTIIEEAIGIKEGVSDDIFETVVEEEISVEEGVSDNISETIVEDEISAEDGVSEEFFETIVEDEISFVEDVSAPTSSESEEKDVSDSDSIETIVEEEIYLVEDVNEEFFGAEINDKVSLREVVFEEGYEDINFVLRIVDTVDTPDEVSVEDSVGIEESVVDDEDTLSTMSEITSISEEVDLNCTLFIDENVPIEDGVFFTTTPFTLGGNALKHLVSVSLIGDDLEGITCTLLYRYSKSAEWSESDAKEMMVNGNVYFGISGREFKLVFNKSTAYTLTSVLVRFKSDDKQFKRGYYGGQIDSQAGR